MKKAVDAFVIKTQMKIREFLTKESGDVNIVSIVVLIGIAVVLAVLFRGAIENLLKGMFNTIEGGATNVIS